MKIFLKYWLPVILYAAVIFAGSCVSQPPKPSWLFPHADKILHIIEYAIFGFLMIRALYSSAPDKKNIYLRSAAVTLVVLYGFADEIHQYFVPLRGPEFADLIMDGLGAFIGQLFFRSPRHCERVENERSNL